MSTETSIWTIISSLSSLGSFGIAALVGWHGYQKYLAEERIEASDDRLELFSTKKQTTELRIENNQLVSVSRNPQNGTLARKIL